MSNQDGIEELEDMAESHGFELVAADTIVVGTDHRRESVIEFGRGALATRQSNNEDDDITIRLEREPDNEHDAYAIKVFGRWALNGKVEERHLGYVYRKMAFKIGVNYDEDTLLLGMFSGMKNNEKGGFDILIHILAKELDE